MTVYEVDLSKPQRQLLKLINRWDGDLAPDAEEQIGCRGEAFWNVLDALRRKGLIIDGAWGTYNLTPLGKKTVLGA